MTIWHFNNNGSTFANRNVQVLTQYKNEQEK
ncbi:hypothetical protein CLV33_11041 [Jejuia pallidilutea]|uniref:Uncharacterized protein n=1 Tax=Jejuia pallidilutea TaxID=504487 RepID=A0A362WXZ7_9FLAO|nr:hypothetical protein CLV33_11041 [Jejuia pallidilutea]